MMKNFQEYFSQFDQTMIDKLESIRIAIRNEIPEGEECIKYLMPTFVFHGKNMIHFAAFTNHIGLYPGPEAISFYEKELSNYKTSKGAIQIPLDQDVPLELIKKIVQHAKARILKTTKTTNK
ncbi:DUF1801 domain-containing protein [Epilithonimonas sp. JDS]|uniref:iron chaperone n=1 Tax=Epilithonimonas sp. JDS TaxID=2902797 RepID=UPI001E2CC89E|nr:DUF1801 domain-containing protein [Epilithonimonas sp. JDS]MCD9853931.1 DUF1801 domain-containing protein [Epilithonimonas sp. JDS]